MYMLCHSVYLDGTVIKVDLFNYHYSLKYLLLRYHLAENVRYEHPLRNHLYRFFYNIL